MAATLINSKQSPTTIRVLGGVLTLIGMMLVAGMGTLMIWMNNLMNNGSSTTKWTGSQDQKTITFLILGSVMAFGFSALLAGIWQLLTGTRSKKLVWLMIGLWGILMISTWVVQIYF